MNQVTINTQNATENIFPNIRNRNANNSRLFDWNNICLLASFFAIPLQIKLFNWIKDKFTNSVEAHAILPASDSFTNEYNTEEFKELIEQILGKENTENSVSSTVIKTGNKLEDDRDHYFWDEVYKNINMADNLIDSFITFEGNSEIQIKEDKRFSIYTMKVASHIVIDDAFTAMRSYTLPLYDNMTLKEVFDTYFNSVESERNIDEQKLLNYIIESAKNIHGLLENIYHDVYPIMCPKSATEISQRNIALQFYFHYVQTLNVQISCARVDYSHNIVKRILDFLEELRSIDVNVVRLFNDVIEVFNDIIPEENKLIIINKLAHFQYIWQEFENMRTRYEDFENYPFAEFFKHLHPGMLREQVYYLLHKSLCENANQPEVKLCLRRLRYNSTYTG